MKIKCSRLWLSTDLPGHKLRGVVGRLFDDPLIHHHMKNGLLYVFPLVQFKRINNENLILGIGGEGSKKVFELFNELNSVGEKINEKQLEVIEEEVGITEQVQKYHFINTWLGLNQTNHLTYKTAGLQERHELLKRIFIGNMLAFSKALRYDVEKRIECKLEVSPVSAVLKGVRILGFIGEVETNFLIPDYVGLGKSTSRGFGTLVKIKSSGGKT